ncbi:hypothetical protein ASE37_24690 [Rhizobium sp. Root268]|nr:hypothetical protein ASC86_24775 [Rhizobium sp. Root1212]KRD26744.1 hypothetical protein ASE37_24690 [Rhizobium sp. Root268]
MRKWKTIEELASMIAARGHARKTVTLTSETAIFVGSHLRTAATKPTRNEVAKIICRNSCSEMCVLCVGLANKICNAYGNNIEG